MEAASVPSYTFAAKEYCLLTKPGIIMGNIITTAAGFTLASKGHFDLLLFISTLAGIAFIIASACVFNNYIDKTHDRKMARTKDRALAKGVISGKGALLFGFCLGLLGCIVLKSFTNTLTLFLALTGFFVYVVLYSLSKYRTMHGTLIGSVAGAIPPLVGYTTVSREIDLPAFIFFSMIVLWQMPHFFAIAISRIDDYKNADIPVLPLKKGVGKTKIQMLVYIVLFTLASFLLTFVGATGYGYLAFAAFLGLSWFCLGVMGLKSKDDRLWARQMFFFSLVVVLGLCAAIPFTVT